ncbi:hypothetical protein D3C74_434830 [compost metagenome]
MVFHPIPKCTCQSIAVLRKMLVPPVQLLNFLKYSDDSAGIQYSKQAFIQQMPGKKKRF